MGTSSKAEARWGWGPGAVVGGVIAGTIVGSAIASRPYYYPYGYYGYYGYHLRPQWPGHPFIHQLMLTKRGHKCVHARANQGHRRKKRGRLPRRPLINLVPRSPFLTPSHTGGFRRSPPIVCAQGPIRGGRSNYLKCCNIATLKAKRPISDNHHNLLRRPGLLVVELFGTGATTIREKENSQ
jgi:hypothetical protein